MTPLHGCLISILNINHSKLNSPPAKPSPHRSLPHHYWEGSSSPLVHTPKAEVILDSHTSSKLPANLPASEHPNSSFLPHPFWFLPLPLLFTVTSSKSHRTFPPPRSPFASTPAQQHTKLDKTSAPRSWNYSCNVLFNAASPIPGIMLG